MARNCGLLQSVISVLGLTYHRIAIAFKAGTRWVPGIGIDVLHGTTCTMLGPHICYKTADQEELAHMLASSRETCQQLSHILQYREEGGLNQMAHLH